MITAISGLLGVTSAASLRVTSPAILSASFLAALIYAFNFAIAAAAAS